MPGAPCAAYSVMNSDPPPTARLNTPPIPPPPPYWVDVVIWMLEVIQESSPDSAKIASPGLSVSSRTGMVVPMIFSSTMCTPIRTDRWRL